MSKKCTKSASVTRTRQGLFDLFIEGRKAGQYASYSAACKEAAEKGAKVGGFPDHRN